MLVNGAWIIQFNISWLTELSVCDCFFFDAFCIGKKLSGLKLGDITNFGTLSGAQLLFFQFRKPTLQCVSGQVAPLVKGWTFIRIKLTTSIRLSYMTRHTVLSLWVLMSLIWALDLNRSLGVCFGNWTLWEMFVFEMVLNLTKMHSRFVAAVPIPSSTWQTQSQRKQRKEQSSWGTNTNTNWWWWRTGGLEDWRTGGLEDWRTGGLEDWRTGGLEDWRWRDDGRVTWGTSVWMKPLFPQGTILYSWT